MVVTATNPLQNTHTPSRNRGSDDDQQVDVVGPDQEDSRHGRRRAVSTLAREDVDTTGVSDAPQVPLPRQSDAQQDSTAGRSQAAAQRTKGRRRSGSSVGTGTGTQTGSRSSARAGVPTPEECGQNRFPIGTDPHAEWIEGFLNRLEARGFFDEAKARDIRTILD